MFNIVVLLLSDGLISFNLKVIMNKKHANTIVGTVHILAVRLLAIV